MNRRDLLIATGALLGAPLIHVAQAQKRLPVLGLLFPGSKQSDIDMRPFEKRLGELGWVEGRTVRVERVYAEDRYERLPALAATLVAKKVDVIWTAHPQGSIAAAQATTSIPIVFWRMGFPVEFGLVDSLSRPGRNATGLAWFADESIYSKRYQLLREIAPRARRLASIGVAFSTWRTVRGDVPDFQPIRDKVRVAAQDLGFEFQPFPFTKPDDFEPMIGAIAKWKPDAIYVQDAPQTIVERKQIIEFARRNRLIDIYETHEWTQEGGLVSFGIVVAPTLERTADYVDRILRGAKPAEIPVEMPSRYELVVNLRTAKAMRHNMPQSVLVRADQVIQ